MLVCAIPIQKHEVLFGFFALRDIDNRAGQSCDAAVGAGKSGLAVNHVMALSVGSRDGRLVHLGTGALPQHLIHRVQPLRDLAVGGVEVMHRFADERFPGHTEELFPRAVHAEIAPVGAFEENRIRQGFDQLLRHALRFGEPVLAPAQIVRDAFVQPSRVSAGRCQ